MPFFFPFTLAVKSSRPQLNYIGNLSNHKCSFMDFDFVGPKFTWSTHFENGNLIWERLDRSMATNSWFLKFSGTRVHHLRCDSFDHCPLLINLTGLDPLFCKKNFWFARCGYLTPVVKKKCRWLGIA